MAPELGLTARREWGARKLPAGESRAAEQGSRGSSEELPPASCPSPALPTPGPSPAEGGGSCGQGSGQGCGGSRKGQGRSGLLSSSREARAAPRRDRRASLGVLPSSTGGHKGPVLSHDRWPVREDGGPVRTSAGGRGDRQRRRSEDVWARVKHRGQSGRHSVTFQLSGSVEP